MEPLLASKGDGLRFIFQKLSEGDAVTISIVIAVVAFTVLFIWAAVMSMKWKGQKLADNIGQCKFLFNPDGLFGKRIFVISGKKEGLPFTIESLRVGKGDYRTVLRIEKPQAVAWHDLERQLQQSREGVASAMSVSETSDSITLEYFGVGGDPKFICTLLAEISGSVRNPIE